MAKKDLYWFKHDSNARRDIKIMELLSDYGYQGYGWWWAILEIMREQSDYRLRLNAKLLAKELYADQEEIKYFIDDCIDKYELFESDGKCFWSPSFINRMNAYDNVCEKRREAAYKSHINR